MARTASQTLDSRDRVLQAVEQGAIVVGASLFVALCAKITVPLTPVPLTVQNFAVILVGLMLGGRRGFAALVLYLAEGASGLPVFTPGPGGIAQLLGPTGGFLIAFPFVAGLAGWLFERGKFTFAWAAVSGFLAEILLFASGVSWLYTFTHSFATAFRVGFVVFIFAEVIKIMVAAGTATSWRRVFKQRA